MDRSERFNKIRLALGQSRVVSFEALRTSLEVSRATLNRDLAYLRDRLNAPIVFDRDAGGYRVSQSDPAAGGQIELPGLWFNAAEIHALLTMQHLLANLDPGGLLAQHIEPLVARLNQLLGSGDGTAEEIRRRILIVGLGKRAIRLEHFERVGSALLRRKRLLIAYYSRGRGELTEREISPQRLVHYRENWYLDAWCHKRRGLRNFAVDSIRRAHILENRRAKSRREPSTPHSAPATAFSPAAASSGRRCASPPSAPAGSPPSTGTPNSAAASRPTATTCSRFRMRIIASCRWTSSSTGRKSRCSRRRNCAS